MAMNPELSSRTVTLLFTDLEGSTRLWEQFPQTMPAALERHDKLLRAAVEGSNGRVIKTTGDGLMAFFASAVDAVSACLEAQRRLKDERWGETGPLRVRMGLHVGEAQLRSGDYYGPAVNRAARLMAAAHGGQVLLSAAAADLVVDVLPEGAALRDLGAHRLKDLERPEHIFQLLHPDLLSDFPPLMSLGNRPNNLPQQPTPLVGRVAELGEILKRLTSAEVRLLTLTGPGGIGKTRTALQAAADLVDRFEDGVYFVDLASIRDPQAVTAAIAHTVELRETSDRPLLETLIEHLRAKRMLLLLDNFEQVVGAAAQVSELLRECHHLKLLVTSREALHVRGENLFPIAPLELPKADPQQLPVEQLTQYDAVRLFVERAQAVKPDFQVTHENAPVIAEICLRLDGLPLAIELAAARIRLFPPQAMLERLENRLSFLRGGARDLPVRQQTLRGAIDWSFELLSSAEQRLFELLSVFPGGCSIEAVEAVASAMMHLVGADLDLIDGLASLVEKSLIRQTDQETGEARLMMLETVREYAAEHLERDPALSAAARRAQAAYFAKFTQRQWQRLTEADAEAALVALTADIDNVRTAWAYWVAAQDLEQLSQLFDGLWRLYDARGWYHATVSITNDLLSVLASTPSTPGRTQQEIMLQTGLARALFVVKGYTTEVETAYQRALELSEAAGEVPQLLPVLRGLSALYTYLGEFHKGGQIAEKMLGLAERQDDATLRAEALMVLGYVQAFTGDMNAGLDYLEKAIAYFDLDPYRASKFRLGNNPGVVCYTTSALFLWMLGFPDRALLRAHGAVDLATRLDHPYSRAYALFHTSLLRLWRREFESSESCAQAVLEIAEEYDFQVWQAVATCLQGAARAGLGQAEAGLAQVRQGITQYQGLRTPPVFWPMLLYIQAGVCGQAGKPAEGLALLDQALAISSHSAGKAMVPEFCRLKGDLLVALSPQNAAEAELWYRQALEVSRQLHARLLELRAALSLSRLWRRQGKAEQGQRLVCNIYAHLTEGFATADLIEASDCCTS